MASDLTGNPWKLDAATLVAEFGALPATITREYHACGEVRWESATAGAGDQVILKDVDGHEIWRSGPATGGDYLDDFKFVDTLKTHGLVVTALPNGILHWYYR